jgi:spore germination protein
MFVKINLRSKKIVVEVKVILISDNDKISSLELGIFIFLALIGMGLLALPSQLAQSVDNDAWVLVLLAGAVSLILLYIMCKVGERHGNLGFVGTLQYLFGKIIGTILAVPVAVFGLFMMASELRLFAEVTKLYLLHRTPLEYIILPMIVLAVILVRMGLEPITRSFGIFIFLIGLVMVILIVVNYQKVDFSNLMPFFSKPISKYIFGITTAGFAYAGFQIIMVLFPYLKTPKKAFKASAIAMLFVMGLYTVITIECIAGLGSEETKALIWPVMALTKAISIPGGFIENVEGLLASMWVLFVLTSIVANMYFFSVIASGTFGHKEHKHFASLSIPIIYLISLQGNSVPEVLKLIDTVINYLGGYTIVALPMLMLIFSYIKGRKK